MADIIIPKRINLAGNKTLAATHIRAADQLLFKVKREASHQGLEQYRGMTRLLDGTVIKAETVFGQTAVTIQSPFPVLMQGGDEFTPPNRSRLIVGCVHYAGNKGEACLWATPAIPITLGYLPGWENEASVATAISHDGNVVVGTCVHPDPYMPPKITMFGQAFIWTVAKGMAAIPMPPNADVMESQAFAVTGDGRYVLGTYKRNPVSLVLPGQGTTGPYWSYKAFIWDTKDETSRDVVPYSWGVWADYESYWGASISDDGKKVALCHAGGFDYPPPGYDPNEGYDFQWKPGMWDVDSCTFTEFFPPAFGYADGTFSRMPMSSDGGRIVGQRNPRPGGGWWNG